MSRETSVGIAWSAESMGSTQKSSPMPIAASLTARQPSIRSESILARRLGWIPAVPPALPRR